MLEVISERVAVNRTGEYNRIFRFLGVRELSSVPARKHGLCVIQDLSELSLSLVARMLDPRAMLWQTRAARFLLYSFPAKWNTVYIVDAPPSFSGLWSQLKKVLPADDIKFLKRSEGAEAQLEEIFGCKVL